MERIGGYYWVLIGTTWMVAEWLGKKWFLTGSDIEYYDYDFDEIGGLIERR